MRLPQNVSYAFLLPLAELALWCTVVLFPVLLLCLEFLAIQHNGHVNLNTGQYQFNIASGQWLGFAISSVCDHHFRLISDLNLPGAIVGAPLTIPAVALIHKDPGFITAQTWHTVTMPFFCIPAWWFIGRGLDLLLAQKRAPALMFWTGSTLSAACLAAAIALVTAPATDRKDLLLFLPGAILWSVAFGLFPFNWFKHRR